MHLPAYCHAGHLANQDNRSSCMHQGLSLMESAMAVIEIARVDCSMSTFLLVHSYLAMLTIGLLVRPCHAGSSFP